MKLPKNLLFLPFWRVNQARKSEEKITFWRLGFWKFKYEPWRKIPCGVFRKSSTHFKKKLKERFNQIKSHNGIFGFLYKVESLKNESIKNIREYLNLEECLKFEGKSDISGNDLAEELQRLSNLVPENSTSIDCLNFIIKSNDNTIFPIIITIRILLTIPVTVASGKTSFSRLKLIKNYLSSTMTIKMGFWV